MSPAKKARKPDFGTPPMRGDGLRTFLLLTVVLAPVLSVAIVGGYGFLVCMSQLLLGPPAG